MPASKKKPTHATPQLAPNSLTRPDGMSNEDLERMFDHAPAAGLCQHEDWTTEGARPGRVRCLDCSRHPLLREAIESMILRALGVRPTTRKEATW